MPHRCVVIDHERHWREYFHELIGEQPGLASIAETHDAPEGLAICRREHPNLVLVDAELPHYPPLAAVKTLTDELDISTIVTTHRERAEYLVRAAPAAGALGLLYKGGGKAVMAEGLRMVLRGERFISAECARCVIDDYDLRGHSKGGVHARPDTLTKNERDVVALVAMGHNCTQCAAILCRSVKTVRWHITNAMRKLDVHSRGELVKFAVAHHLAQYIALLLTHDLWLPLLGLRWLNII